MKKTVSSLVLSLALGTAMAQAPTNGLVADYPFCGNANDLTSNARHGTVNGASLTTDRFGKANAAYSFNGTNSTISFTGVPTTNTANWGISAWVLPSSLDQNGIAISNGGDNGVNSGNGYSFGIAAGTTGTAPGSGGRLQGLYSGVSFLNGGYIFPNTTTWRHIVMTRNATTLSFYVDGVLQALTYTNAPTTPNQFSIGGQKFLGSIGSIRHFSGKIDDVKVYNRALTATDVSALFSDANTPCCALQISQNACTGNTYSYTSKFNAYGAAGLAIDASNNFFVTDVSNNVVAKYNSAGVYQSNVPGFTYPLGLAVDGSGNLFVADYGASRIVKVTPAGVKSYFYVYNTVGEVISPVFVAVDGCGNVYATATVVDKVFKFDNNGLILTPVDPQSPGDQNHLSAVGVDVMGNVFVIDETANLVKRITPSGTVTSWALPSTSYNELAVDKGGNVYLIAGGSNPIKKYSNAGTLLASFGRAPEGSEPSWSPFGVDVDANCNVWAAYGSAGVSTFGSVTKFSYTSASPRMEEGGELTVNNTTTSVQIAPNPSSGDFTLSLPSNGNFTLEVLGMNGESVLKQSFSGSKYVIQDGALKAGVYMVRLSGDVSQTLRIIKSK